MRENSASQLGTWAFIGLWAALATVLVSDINRFLWPVSEKYVDHIGAGGADLLPSFNSARALLDGQSPYHYEHKWPRVPHSANYGGFLYQYPPTHALVYVPLVWFTHGNFGLAARVHFYLSLLAIAAVAVALVELTGAALTLSRDLRRALVPMIAVVIALNPGSQLGFERGQSDVFTAALCWGAVACFQRRRFALAAFLGVASGLLKGYGVPFGAGLALLGLRRDAWRATLLGAAFALLVLLAPVARYLPDAVGAYGTRAEMFWSSWNNQSIYNLVYTFSPPSAAWGRKLAIGASGLVTVLSWWRAHRALARGTEQESAIALGLFTCSSLIFILTFSLNSLVYNTALVLPGGLFLVLVQSSLSSGAPAWRTHALGLLLAASAFGLFAMSALRVVGRSAAFDPPLHAIAQLVLLAVIAALCVSPLRRTEPRAERRRVTSRKPSAR